MCESSRVLNTMVNTCVIYSCRNRSDRGDIKRSYHAVPKIILSQGDLTKELSTKRRELWVVRIGRKNWTPTPNSDHFVSGCPSNLYKKDDINWAPTVKLGRNKVREEPEEDERCEIHAKLQEEKRKRSEGAEALLQFHKIVKSETPDLPIEPPIEPQVKPLFNPPIELLIIPLIEPQQEIHKKKETARSSHNVACQTNLTFKTVVCMEEELQRLNGELYELRSKVLNTGLRPESFENNPGKTKYYTGLPNYLALMQLLKL